MVVQMSTPSLCYRLLYRSDGTSRKVNVMAWFHIICLSTGRWYEEVITWRGNTASVIKVGSEKVGVASL
jgi:hypothetical protein